MQHFPIKIITDRSAYANARLEVIIFWKSRPSDCNASVTTVHSSLSCDQLVTRVIRFDIHIILSSDFKESIPHVEPCLDY